jgi:tetratricopeptide (TPR) repeat protein
VLGAVGRVDEALALYDEISGVDESTSVRALAWKIELLNEVARHREAVALGRHAVARFDGASDPDVRRYLASAHVQLGLALEAMRDWRGAIAAYERMLAVFPAGEAPDIDAQRQWVELHHAALRTMRWVDVHRGWLGAGAAALLIFTVVVGTGRRRDRERRPVAIRLRQGAERGR